MRSCNHNATWSAPQSSQTCEPNMLLLVLIAADAHSSHKLQTACLHTMYAGLSRTAKTYPSYYSPYLATPVATVSSSVTTVASLVGSMGLSVATVAAMRGWPMPYVWVIQVLHAR